MRHLQLRLTACFYLNATYGFSAGIMLWEFYTCSCPYAETGMQQMDIALAVIYISTTRCPSPASSSSLSSSPSSPYHHRSKHLSSLLSPSLFPLPPHFPAGDQPANQTHHADESQLAPCRPHRECQEAHSAMLEPVSSFSPPLPSSPRLTSFSSHPSLAGTRLSARHPSPISSRCLQHMETAC